MIDNITAGQIERAVILVIMYVET